MKPFPGLPSLCPHMNVPLCAYGERDLESSLDFPDSPDGKESACSSGELRPVSGSGRPLGDGNGYPLHYSSLENPMDKGAWRATVHGVAKSGIQLSD